MFRKPTNFQNHFQRGQATLEIVIVLLILIPLIFGGIEISHGVAVRAALDNGVAVAAQALSIDPNQWGWSATVVASAVNENVFGIAGLGPVHLEAYNSGGVMINGNICKLGYGEPFYLVGWVTYTPDIPLLTLSTITIRVRHYGIIQYTGTPC